MISNTKISFLRKDKRSDLPDCDLIYLNDAKCIFQYDDEEILGFEKLENKKYFLYKELLPISLSEKIGYDKYKEFVFTNQELDIMDFSNINKVNDKYIFYF